MSSVDIRISEFTNPVLSGANCHRRDGSSRFLSPLRVDKT